MRRRMAVLAVDTAWVGVIGTALGGLIGFVASWSVHRMERAARVGEVLRTERRDLYGAFLTKAEDSLHLFQWVAEGHISPAGSEADKAKANRFYDQEVTPRLMVLRIVGSPDVVSAGSQMRQALNDVRHLMIDDEIVLSDESPQFMAAHRRYRRARDNFIALAHVDLQYVPTRRGHPVTA